MKKYLFLIGLILVFLFSCDRLDFLGNEYEPEPEIFPSDGDTVTLTTLTRFDWPDVKGAEEYEIEVMIGASSCLRKRASTSNLPYDSLYFTQTGEYKWHFRFRKGNDWSNWSDDYSFTFQFVPSPPTEVNITGIGMLEIKWQGVALAGVKEYRLYRSESPEGPYSRIYPEGKGAGKRASSVIDNQLAVISRERERKGDIGQSSNQSNTGVHQLVGRGEIPLCGSDAKSSGRSLHPRRVQHAQPTNNQTHNTLKGVTPTKQLANQPTNNLLPDTYSYTDTSLENKKMYYYKISVVGLNNKESDKSDYTSGTAFDAPNPPDSVVVTDIGEFTVYWTDVMGLSNLAGYKVYRSTNSTSGFSEMVSLGVTSTQWTDAEVAFDSTYYYKLSVYGTGGEESNLSSAVSQTTFISIVPDSVRITGIGELGIYWSPVSKRKIAQIFRGIAFRSGGVKGRQVLGLSGYNIYRSISPTGSYNKVNTAPITQTFYVDSDLANNTAYYYKLTIVTTSGYESSLPDNHSYGITFDKPLPPLSAEITGIGMLRAEWNTISGLSNLAGYNVYRSNSPSGTYQKLNSSILTETTFTDSLLSNNATYYYKISAVSTDSQESNLSDYKSGTTFDAPDTLVITGADTNWIALSWTDCSWLSNFDHYNLYRGVDDSTNLTVFATPTANLLTDSDVDCNSHSYFYRVSVVSSEGEESNPSNILSVLQGPLPPVLYQPTNNDTISDCTPYFDWSDPSKAVKYWIQVDNNGNFSSPEISDSAITVSNYTAGSSLSCDKYYWRVKARNSLGLWGGWSSTWNFTIMISEMVYVPAGEFTMGSDPGEGDSNEEPEHTVYLDAYYIDKYEVTNRQYCDFMNEWGSNDDGEGHSLLDLDDADCQIYESGGTYYVESGKDSFPVIEVSWYGAKTYCEWRGGRLPTEAEWEKAARGTDERKYPWGNGEPDDTYANYGGIAGHTTPVGSYEKGESPYGCYDMAGNVYEWCNDWYYANYYSVSPHINPQGPASGTYRVIRGGSWLHNSYNLRCGNRNYYTPSCTWNYSGFRWVVSAK